MILLMDEILHHLKALNYCSSLDIRGVRWCKISSISTIKRDTRSLDYGSYILDLQPYTLVWLLFGNLNQVTM